MKYRGNTFFLEKTANYFNFFTLSYLSLFFVKNNSQMVKILLSEAAVIKSSRFLHIACVFKRIS